MRMIESQSNIGDKMMGKIIESESTIVLTRRESLRLLELIENPPPRNEKFLQAQARYQGTKINEIPASVAGDQQSD